MYIFVTARKRSLGQGNIFTPVCHSVHGGLLRGGAWSRGVPGPMGVPGPRGMPAPGGVPGGDPQTATAAAVRILLECILVFIVNSGGHISSIPKHELTNCNHISIN